MYFKSFERILYNQCANCTKSFPEEIRNSNHSYKSKSSSNASTALIFTNLELDSCPVEDVTNFQAVSYIYGVSPVSLENSIKKHLTNLAIKHNDNGGSSVLEEEKDDEEDDPLGSLNLSLCQNCSRILAKLYIIFYQFEKLSNKKSIIAKGLQYSKENSEFHDIKLESLSEEEILENPNEGNNIDDLQNSLAEQLETGSIKEEFDSDSFSTFNEGKPSDGEDYHHDVEDANPFHGDQVEAETEEEASQNSGRVELRRSLRRPRKSAITVRSSLTDNENEDDDTDNVRSNSSSDEYCPSEELDAVEKIVPHRISNSAKRRCIEPRGRSTCVSPNKSGNPLPETIAPAIKITQCKRCLKVFSSSYYKNLHVLAQKLDIKALEKQKLHGDCPKCPKCEISFIRVSPGPTQLKIHCLKEHNLIVSRSEANKLEQFTQYLLSEKYYCDKNKNKGDYTDSNTECTSSTTFINVQGGSEKNSIPSKGFQVRKNGNRCNRCSKVFCLLYYKQMHIYMQHHDIQTLTQVKLQGDRTKCPECGLGFSRKSPGPLQLKSHCLTKHNLIVYATDDRLEHFLEYLQSEKEHCNKNRKSEDEKEENDVQRMAIASEDSKSEESEYSISKKNNNENGKSFHVPKNGKLHSNVTSSLRLSTKNQCNKCLKVFCVLYYKQMHIYVQHRDIQTLPQAKFQGDRTKCPECGLGFSRKSPGPLQLKAHCLTKHNLIVYATEDRLEHFMEYLQNEKEHCNKNRKSEDEKEENDVQRMAIAGQSSRPKNGKLLSNETSSLSVSTRNQCNRCLKVFCLHYYKQIHTYVQHRDIKTLAQETFNSLKRDRLRCSQCGMEFNSKSPGPLQLKAHCLTKHNLVVSANDDRLEQFVHYLQSEKLHCNKNKISNEKEESDVHKMAIAGKKKMDQSPCSYGIKTRRSQLRKHFKPITNSESVTVTNEDNIEKTEECNTSEDNSRYSSVESGGSVDNETDDRLGREKPKTSENNSVSIEENTTVDENKNSGYGDISRKESNLIKFGVYNFECFACKKYFSHIISFKRHITKVHNVWWKDPCSFKKWLALWTQKCYNCEVCDDSYISKQELNVHLLTHMLEQDNAIEFNEVIEGPPFRCPISKCQDPNKDYNNWCQLQMHGFKAHEVAFTNQRQQETIKSLSPTDAEVVKTKKFSCNTCEAQFPNVRSLWMHTLVHIVEGYEDIKTATTYEAFSESFLGSVVDIETNVKNDCKISVEANTMSCSPDVDVCSNCRKSFKSFYAMKIHQFAAKIVDFNELAVEEVSGKEFICSSCGIVCERSIILRQHCLSSHNMIISTKNYHAEEFLKELHKEKEHCHQNSSATAAIAYQSDNPCQRCCKAFTSSDNQQIHTIAQKLEVESLSKEVLHGLNYLCPKCDRYFTKDPPGPLRLKIHCILKHNLIVAESETKLETFTQHLQSEKKHCNDNVKENVKIVNDERTFVRTCSMCERVSSPFEMKIHSLAHKIDLTAVEIINVEGSVNFQCPRCPKVLASNIQLRGHCLEMHNVVTSTDDIPADQFMQFLKEEQEFIERAVEKTNNIQQRNSGNGEAMLNSEHATPGMETDEDLKKSIKRKRKRKTKSCFKCGFCSKTFSGPYEKYAHVLKHFEWRTMEVQTIFGPPFKCTSCDEVLPTFRSIRVHCISVHGFNVSNNYKLKTSKYPNASSELQNSSGVDKVTDVAPHKEISEKFICDTCGKSYGKKAYLISHKRFVHRLEKQFMCERCGVSFKQANLLRFHRKVHYEKDNGIRPTCNICGKDYISSACLAKHKRKYHSKDKPVCPICNKTFASKEYAATHIKKHKKLVNK